MKEKLQGKFIVLDGPDGCGKSVQAELLVDWLRNQAVTVRSFRDPGTTEVGEKLRRILLDREHVAMDTRTELLLYMAARAQLWAEKVEPALKKGEFVILDRWLSSTCAYQGYAGGFGIERVKKIACDSLKRPWPDLTIILDVDVETASARLWGLLDRIELKGIEYHKKVRRGFLELAERMEFFVVVDASIDIQRVHFKVREVIENRFF